MGQTRSRVHHTSLGSTKAKKKRGGHQNWKQEVARREATGKEQKELCFDQQQAKTSRQRDREHRSVKESYTANSFLKLTKGAYPA